MTLIKAAGISLLLALGACAQTQAVSEPAATVVAVSPSPRPECAPAHVTLYFGEQISSDEPVVTPLLGEFMQRIRGCEAAGGELRSITVVATPDPGQSPADARAQARRRVERVSAALVNAGAAADKISEGVAPATEEIMSRRAEITANLY